MRLRIKELFSLSITVSLFGLLLISCSKKPDTSQASSDGDKPVVALIMKSLANEFFKTMGEGGEKHHADNADKYDLIVNGIKNESDVSSQVDMVEQMMSRGADAIVIAPADSKALIPILKRAQDAGILVINIDNKLDSKILSDLNVELPFVGPDNREGARMVGEVVAKQLNPGDEVAIIEGIPTTFNAQQRKLGFEDAMKAGGVKIVSSQSGYWEIDKGNNVAAAMLSEHNNLKALLCANDSMALGAVAAVKAAGLQGKVLVAGFDNITAVQPMILNGEMIATADQHGDQLAAFGIQAALDILSGGSTPEDKQTKVDLITRKSLNP
jgi:ribose transport system substrate-binding protein